MTDDLYHYTESGLETVWLRGGVTRSSTPRGEGTSISDIDGLRREIGKAVLRKRGVLTGAHVRFLRREMGKSWSELAEAVGLCADHSGAIEGVEAASLRHLPVDAGIDARIRVLYTHHLIEAGTWDDGGDWRWWLHPVDTRRLIFAYTDDGWRLEGDG